MTLTNEPTMIEHAPTREDSLEARGYSFDRHLSDGDRWHYAHRAAVTGAASSTPAMDHARYLLLHMATDEATQLSYRRINNFLRFVASVTDQRTVYPAITPDGLGGATFQWTASRRVIELELAEDGRYFLLCTDAFGATSTSEGAVHQLDLERLRAELSDFTNFVESQNPAWRENF